VLKAHEAFRLVSNPSSRKGKNMTIDQAAKGIAHVLESNKDATSEVLSHVLPIIKIYNVVVEQAKDEKGYLILRFKNMPHTGCLPEDTSFLVVSLAHRIKEYHRAVDIHLEIKI